MKWPTAKTLSPALFWALTIPAAAAPEPALSQTIVSISSKPAEWRRYSEEVDKYVIRPCGLAAAKKHGLTDEQAEKIVRLFYLVKENQVRQTREKVGKAAAAAEGGIAKRRLVYALALDECLQADSGDK